MKKILIKTAFLSLLFAGILSGCGVEHDYYRQNHHHSPEYEGRHQPRVNLDIHN